MNAHRLVHPFPACFDSNAKVLILGSFPSVVSRQLSFYYANKTNRFWPVLAAVYQDEMEDHAAFCAKHHIALWDVIKSCTIHGSADSSIDHVVCNDISSLTDGSKIKAVFTTGKKASDLYERYIQCSLPHISLPSTSAAYASMKMDDLVKCYRILREYTDEEN